MTVSLIVARDLVKRFDDFTAVDHISFEVPEGVVFGFLGPNGAGKTTTDQNADYGASAGRGAAVGRRP